MLKLGSAAPDFTLPDETGKPVSLRTLLAEGPVALVFYPRDFTPVCTREVCMVRDLHGDLAATGLRVVGISTDSVETHARFRAEHGLPFPLLSDTDATVCRAYDAIGLLGMTRRITYIIDQSGCITDAVEAGLRVKAHETLLRRASHGLGRSG